MPLDAPPPQKRKLSNAAQPAHKKQKTDGSGAHKENSSNDTANGQSTSSKPEPTAYYCHQCNKKRDVPDNPKGKGPRCRAKYCRNCLRNRYNEDIDDNKLVAPTPRDGVRDEAAYSYRKANGLEPLRQDRKQKGGEDRQTASTSKLVHADNHSAPTKPEVKTPLAKRLP
ncbi:hypothetical protein MPER_07900, partial [Moniliophthora perniciosa FA553]